MTSYKGVFPLPVLLVGVDFCGKTSTPFLNTFTILLAKMISVYRPLMDGFIVVLGTYPEEFPLTVHVQS